MSYRLGVLASHPIQYQAPLFRELANRLDLQVFFAHRQTAEGQAEAGFGVAFEWDLDLLDGYAHKFLSNRSRSPNVNRFSGCDTPDIGAEIRDGHFDAFLVTGWYLKSFWQAVRACKRYGVPVMVRGDSQLGTPRGALKHVAKELIYPRLLAQFDAHLFVGQRNRDYLEHYGVSSDHLYFSPHFVDNDWFSDQSDHVDVQEVRAELGINASDYVVLFAGKFIQEKRPLDLVRALEFASRDGLSIHGVFVGAGPMEKGILGEARSIRVPVKLAGFRNQSELPSLYASADLLVLPSGSETWGLVVNEAMACGTPTVVSSAVGCAPDLIDEGLTGSTYPVGDVTGLGEAIRSMLGAKQDRRVQAALKSKVNRYSMEAASDGIVRAISRLAGDACA